MIAELRHRGFTAVSTIWDTNGIRTDATAADLRAAAHTVKGRTTPATTLNNNNDNDNRSVDTKADGEKDGHDDDTDDELQLSPTSRRRRRKRQQRSKLLRKESRNQRIRKRNSKFFLVEDDHGATANDNSSIGPDDRPKRKTTANDRKKKPTERPPDIDIDATIATAVTSDRDAVTANPSTSTVTVLIPQSKEQRRQELQVMIQWLRRHGFNNSTTKETTSTTNSNADEEQKTNSPISRRRSMSSGVHSPRGSRSRSNSGSPRFRSSTISPNIRRSNTMQPSFSSSTTTDRDVRSKDTTTKLDSRGPVVAPSLKWTEVSEAMAVALVLRQCGVVDLQQLELLTRQDLESIEVIDGVVEKLMKAVAKYKNKT